MVNDSVAVARSAATGPSGVETTLNRSVAVPRSRKIRNVEVDDPVVPSHVAPGELPSKYRLSAVRSPVYGVHRIAVISTPPASMSFHLMCPDTAPAGTV